MISKLAAIVKPRADGSLKTRLVVDMRRSGVNACVRLQERIVLPRIQDVVADVMDLTADWSVGAQRGGTDMEFLSVGFADAFQTLGVREEEKNHQVVAGMRGEYYLLDSVAFGERVLLSFGGVRPRFWEDRDKACRGRQGHA